MLLPGDLVRPGLPRDVPLLAAVERAAASRFAAIGLRGAFLESTVDAGELALAAGEGRLWVAEHRRECVGFAMARLLDDGEPWLEELDVHPAHGRRGLGLALLEAVIAWARGRGASGLSLSTFRRVPWNAPFYERAGFREIPAGARTAAHARMLEDEKARGLPVEDRLLMRLPLANPPAGA